MTTGPAVCRYAGPVFVEGTVVDHSDGRGPRFEFRVTSAGPLPAFCCVHSTLDSLLAAHPATDITIKEST